MNLKKVFKATLPFSIASYFLFFSVNAAEISPESKITRVTVYPDSALVSRTATLDLEAGEFKIIFSDIVPAIDENSLRVQAEGAAGVKLFGAQLKREQVVEDPSEKVDYLQKLIEEVSDEIKIWQNKKEVLLEKKSFLDSIKLFSGGQIPKDLVTKTPSPRELSELLEFLEVSLKEVYSLKFEADLKIRELARKREVLQRELRQIAGPRRKVKRSIVVDLKVLTPGVLNLDVTYLVRGASWRPIYDARANFEKSEVEFISYAIIKQATGEDWPDVEISLSTARPVLDARMPYIAPWILQERKAPIAHQPRRDMLRAKQYMAFESADLKEEVYDYAQVKETGIAVDYKLTRKATIKSDGSDHKLPVSVQTLKADFEYAAYPRVSTHAYLGSRVTNRKDLQLLAGRVNIFLEGAFVGSSSIDNIAPGEEFDLYLGIDENVKIKREMVEKKTDDTWIAGIPSRTKRNTFRYKLSVENYKSDKINIKLFEAMPVSQQDRLRVRISDVTQEASQKDWQDRAGIWLWEFKLKPREKKEIFYSFTIEHPRDMEIEGL